MDMLDLKGKRVLLTQADTFMGPALQEVFAALGAAVIADRRPLVEPQLPERIVADAGPVDILIAHLAVAAPRSHAQETTEAEWQTVFDHLVHPLPRLLRAVLPAMIQRRSGKVLLIGSAAPLRGMKRASTYSAARGAQLAYIRAVGVEVAPHNIQVNAIAQNFVDNPTYFPPEIQANPAFQERLKREVPLGRLVSGREDALLAAYLCSPAADCFVGQVFPVCGGWAA
ncbi:SDR family oxidoreductase [Desulfatitalea alkaliphila]|uniref:SDR family oxidoreductase n=1 Tax=Desulfatitalea alkaliphila TaxID=2929485 RepID=A0AA41R8Y9_9BACT|nr:SDR family oxidoreductase [Desulfatitalea alkaliphila]MCJ8501038.1 SDR family oxidoreductase [Desulfatitalea alkaliphila]